MAYRALLFVFVVVLAGCSKPQEVAAPAEIAWFEGSVEAALVEAKESARPVFLYWGAAWCPYCQQLKSSVFTRRDIADKLRFFVPVYLDGDDAGAQKWGDELKVSGYPTVLILRPDGTELMRIGGGMDVERYAGILDLALEDTKPVAEILAGLEGSSGPLSPADCARLAYHGFALDSAYTDDAPRTAALLTAAASRCQAGSAERARLEIQAAIAEPTPPRVAAVIDLLADTGLSVAVADALFALDDDFLVLARGGTPASAAELAARWSRVMETAALDPRYSESDRLFALNTHLRGARAFGTFAPELASAARARVEEVLARQHDGFARASIVNAALWVFDTLGDDDRIYSLAESELQTATNPYYLMLDLAGIEEKRGRTESALAWMQRAYDEAQGPATRFQWGTSYVAGLIRMRPADEATIRDTALAVLGELAPDSLHGRTNTRLSRLEKVLNEWNASGEHAAAVRVIAERMQALCTRVSRAEQAACSGFLASDAA